MTDFGKLFFYWSLSWSKKATFNLEVCSLLPCPLFGVEQILEYRTYSCSGFILGLWIPGADTIQISATFDCYFMIQVTDKFVQFSDELWIPPLACPSFKRLCIHFSAYLAVTGTQINLKYYLVIRLYIPLETVSHFIYTFWFMVQLRIWKMD